MKRSLIYSALVICLGILIFATIKLPQSYRSPIATQLSTEQDEISILFQENEEHIDRVFALCETTDDSMRSFGTEAYNILNDHNQWNQKYLNILKEQPEILKKIEIEWLDAADKIATSIDSEENNWIKQKKAYAIQAIESFISKETLADYVKDKKLSNVLQ